MKAVKILTCSTGSLSREIVKKYGIIVVPYYVMYGGKTYKEDFNFDHKKYFKELRDMKKLPTTSHPTSQDLEKIYRHLGRGEAIFITLSSKYSGTYEIAVSGKEKFKDLTLEIFDSRAGIGKQGILAVEAARCANEGKGVKEILEYIKKVDERSSVYGVFGTLKYLAKGGRIGKAQSLLGSILSIKPILGIRDGITVPIAKVRTHQQGLEWIIKKIKEDMERFDSQKIRCIIEDVDNEEWRSRAQKRLVSEFDVEEIWKTEMSLISGTHVGPGAWAITYYCL